jgi:hypothetical protein
MASRTTNARAGQVMLGLLQGTKRGCAPVSDGFKVVACEKHKKALTQQIPAEDLSTFPAKFDEIWSRRVVSSRDGDSSANKDGSSRDGDKSELKDRRFRRRLKNPSNHASFESKRSEGGRAGWLNRWLRKTQGVDNTTTFGSTSGKSFSCEFTPVDDLLDMFETNDSPGTTSRYGIPLCSYDHALLKARAQVTHGTYGGNADHPDWIDDFAGWLAEPDPESALKSKENLRSLRAQVELCLEPLKCRVITKGESLPYWVSQTFQKQAWQSLQDTPAFALTGTTVNSSHLYHLDKMTSDLELGFDQWVSGDYSAATDGLSSEVNQMAMDSLLQKFGATPDETAICKQVLGNHVVQYPEKLETLAHLKGIDLSPFVMKNGQLMGSLLSFPVLCAINLVAYWSALEEYTGRTFRKEELPCLINGDDILFKSNAEFYPIWQKWITKAGFTLSVGKNYISPNFLTVNSESWLHTPNGIFKKLKWLNCGLLLQEARGPCQIPLRTETAERPLIPKLQWILDNCVNKERSYNRIKHYWKKSISIWTDHGYYNLACPVEWGGCGLLLPEELRQTTKFTYSQQALAGFARLRQKVMVGDWVRNVPPSGFERVAVVDTAPKVDVTRKFGGKLVLKDRLEPLRANERRFKDPKSSERVAAELMNCQQTNAGEQPTFRIQKISRRRIASAYKFAKKGYTIRRPFENSFEFRHAFDQGPTDDASLLPGPLPVGENIAEMTTDLTAPLKPVQEWSDDGFSQEGSEPQGSLIDWEQFRRHWYFIRNQYVEDLWADEFTFALCTFSGILPQHHSRQAEFCLDLMNAEVAAQMQDPAYDAEEPSLCAHYYPIFCNRRDYDQRVADDQPTPPRNIEFHPCVQMDEESRHCFELCRLQEDRAVARRRAGIAFYEVNQMPELADDWEEWSYDQSEVDNCVPGTC